MSSTKTFWEMIDAREEASPGARPDIDAALWKTFGTRKAIMFTDLSGFTRLSVKSGIESFLGVIRSSHRLFEPLIHEAQGKILKYEGDSLLVVFDSVESALETIDAMYLAADGFNASRDIEERVLLCVGLGFGDVLLVDEHELFGLEVNLASRLGEDTARPGEVLMTSDAVDGTKDPSLKSRIVAISDEPGDAVSMWSFRPKRSQAI